MEVDDDGRYERKAKREQSSHIICWLDSHRQT